MTLRRDTKPSSTAARWFGFGRRRAKRVPANRLLPAPKTAGVYVDIENLKSTEHSRSVIETVVRDWPDQLAPIRRLRLYAPADKAGLWKTWAAARFPDLDVNVRGIQHFTRTSSKNSADLAIVADAVDDFRTGAASHIAVVSNDSDFGALLIKIEELAAGAGQPNQPPFLWINLPGAGGLSKEIEDFVPEPLRWTITSVPQPEPKNPSKPVESKGDHLPANATIVRWLLKGIPPGKFKADDARKIIARHSPKHPAVQTTTACGQFLARELMPLLKNEGVKIVGQKPNVYERSG